MRGAVAARRARWARSWEITVEMGRGGFREVGAVDGGV